MGYRAADIKAKTGFTTRTVNNWIRRGVLPKVEFRGANTTYSDEHVVRLQAIRALRSQGYYAVQIQAFFKTATPADIRKIAGLDKGAAPAATPTATATPSAAATNVARWTHVTLAPGVMLLVRDDASDSAAKIAAVFKGAFGAAT